MDKDTYNFMMAATWVVGILLAIGITATLLFSHFHDWDCSKHQGLLNPNGVYSYSSAQANQPGVTKIDVTATQTVCRDGYRP